MDTHTHTHTHTHERTYTHTQLHSRYGKALTTMTDFTRAFSTVGLSMKVECDVMRFDGFFIIAACHATPYHTMAIQVVNRLIEETRGKENHNQSVKTICNQ